MAASVEYKTVMKEKEGDLSMFLEMRNRERGRNDLSLLQSSDEFDDSFGSKPKIASIMQGLKTRADDFLDSENGKTDYDWLLTPPCTPLDKGVVKATANSNAAQTTAQRSRLAEPPIVSVLKSGLMSSRRTRSSSAGTRRQSSLRGGSVASRPATPTGRPTLPAIVRPLRSSVPSSGAAVSSSKTVAPTSSSAPTKSSARSLTPTGRPSILAASKSASRSASPCQSTQSSISGAAFIKKPLPSRGVSPTVKSQPRKPSETLGSGRSVSASKERPHSTETASGGKPRQKPYSPSNVQVSNVKSQNSVKPVLLRTRKYPNSNWDVNPVLMGTQMVERVVNMRKLVPPKQNNPQPNHSNSSGKTSSQDSSGFGRSLSKKSLDMAIRHMDISRSISGNMRSLMKDVPASSLYSLRSELKKLGTSSTSDSLVTSSDASSERSFNISNSLDVREVEDIDLSSEQEHSSSNSQHDLLDKGNEGDELLQLEARIKEKPVFAQEANKLDNPTCACVRAEREKAGIQGEWSGDQEDNISSCVCRQ